MHHRLPIVTSRRALALNWLKSDGSKSAGIRLNLAEKAAPIRTFLSQMPSSGSCHDWIDD